MGTPVEIDTHSSILIQLNLAEQQSLALVYNVSVADSPCTHFCPFTYQSEERGIIWLVGGVVGGIVGCDE